MKHLIELTDESSLTREDYDRIILADPYGVIFFGGGDYSNDYPYVDLGLSVKWAKCNVGAKKETDYGDYFMWGETTPNITCNWMKNPFNNGSAEYNEEYFNAHKLEWLDDNGNLKPEYDAARANMGGDWRMPTEAEFRELLDNTRYDYFSNYKGSGADGIKFTSTINGNSIFIPAAGFREGDRVIYDRVYGDIWSSSLIGSEGECVSGFDVARYLTFDSGRFGPRLQYHGRCNGLSVRGVL